MHPRGQTGAWGVDCPSRYRLVWTRASLGLSEGQEWGLGSSAGYHGASPFLVAVETEKWTTEINVL